MDGFLRKAGLKIFALFLSLMLVFTLSLSTVSAQDDMADFDWDEWETQMQQALDDAAWTEYDDTWDDWYDDDDYWGTGYTYDTTTEFEGSDFLAFGIVMGIWAIFMLPLYIYMALALMTIAKKLGIDNAWLAWIPIVNLFIFVRCAGLSLAFLLLLLIPFVNFFVILYMYWKIAERRGFEPWIGILIIVPVIGIAIPGYLAWAEPPKKAQ